MVQTSYPGVYIQEVPSSVHTITGISTSVTAFIGCFREGPMNKAVQIFGMADFNRVYGGLDNKSEASYAIAQFFLNGGTEAQVIRVASKLSKKASVEIKKGTSDNDTSVMTVEALNEGEWGNKLRVQIDYNTKAPEKLFNLRVARHAGTKPLDPITAAETHLNLSVDSNDPRYFVNVIENASQLIKVKQNKSGLPAATGTYGKSIKLDAASIAQLKGKKFKVKISSDTSKPHTAILNWTESNPKTLLELRSHLEEAIRTADPKNSPAYTKATVELVNKNRFLVRSGRAKSSKGQYDSAETISITVEGNDTSASDLGLTGSGVSENVQEYVLGVTDAKLAQKNGVKGVDGLGADANAIKGDPTKKTGLYALEQVDLFNILSIPRAASLKSEEMMTVVDEALAYCEKRRSFMIIDIPKEINTVQKVKDWLDSNRGLRHRNAALYFPRLKIPDPANEYRLRSVGASGTLAGLYSRIDSVRGVWKAPAGTEAILQGVGQLDVNLTDAENGALNPLAINCLRTFPVYGPVSWGARTLAGSDQAGSEWKYIPIRRLALFLEESLFRGTKWVVFQPNDEPLWAKIRLNLNAFMMSLFRQGAFQGSTPDKAFYVKCDSETTTQADRNLGIVNIEVGFAPLKPAEFVVIKVQQIAGDL